MTASQPFVLQWGVAEIGKELGKMWTDTPEGDRKVSGPLACAVQ